MVEVAVHSLVNIILYDIQSITQQSIWWGCAALLLNVGSAAWHHHQVTSSTVSYHVFINALTSYQYLWLSLLVTLTSKSSKSPGIDH